MAQGKTTNEQFPIPPIPDWEENLWAMIEYLPHQVEPQPVLWKAQVKNHTYIWNVGRTKPEALEALLRTWRAMLVPTEGA